MLSAFRATLLDESLDPSLRAYSLSLPDFSTLAQVRSALFSPEIP